MKFYRYLEKWNFLFYCNLVVWVSGGVVGLYFIVVLISVFFSFVVVYMVDDYYFMVIVISNLVENDS